MNSYPVLGIDLDGVVYQFYQEFKLWWAELQNVDPNTFDAEPQTYAFFEEMGCTVWRFKELLREGLVNKRLYWSGDAYPGAVETLQNLSNDHKIIIVTSRNFWGLEKLSEEAAVHWLTSKNIPFDDLILTDEKTGLGLDLMLDDASHIIKSARAAGEKAVFFDAPHNRHIDHDRVYSWREFEDFVG